MRIYTKMRLYDRNYTNVPLHISIGNQHARLKIKDKR